MWDPAPNPVPGLLPALSECMYGNEGLVALPLASEFLRGRRRIPLASVCPQCVTHSRHLIMLGSLALGWDTHKAKSYLSLDFEMRQVQVEMEGEGAQWL